MITPSGPGLLRWPRPPFLEWSPTQHSSRRGKDASPLLRRHPRTMAPCRRTWLPSPADASASRMVLVRLDHRHLSNTQTKADFYRTTAQHHKDQHPTPSSIPFGRLPIKDGTFPRLQVSLPQDLQSKQGGGACDPTLWRSQCGLAGRDEGVARRSVPSKPHRGRLGGETNIRQTTSRSPYDMEPLQPVRCEDELELQ